MKSAFLFSGIAIVALVAACGGNSVAPAPRPSVDGGDRNDATSGAPSSTDSSTDEGADTALGPDGPDTTCGPDSVARIAVGSGTVGSPFDPLGYAPYAIDGCTLAYVTPSVQGQTSGELRVRQLATGDEKVLAPASEQPRRPSIVGDLIAWEAVAGGKSIVRVSKGGLRATIGGPFDHAGEPRVTSDAVVFTAWLSSDDAGDTDVYLYSPASQQLVAIATGAGQQRFADVSALFVAVSDFSEDPTGAFSPYAHRDADIVVFDRKTLAKTVRHLPGKQAFPMLGDSSHLGYLDWGSVTPEPKFSAYAIRAGDVASDPAIDGNAKGAGQVQVNTPYVRPSVRGNWLEWVDDSPGSGGLFRCPIDLSQAATSTLIGYQLLGPVAGQPLTVVASAGSGYVLRGVAR
jgi:hypothetical protein